jgi:hypothetical protein
MNGIYERRHILFCDILGFTQAILKRRADPAKFLFAFSHIQAMVQEANRVIDPEIVEPETGRRYDYLVSTRAEHFSDCIVVSTPATNVDAIWLCQAAAEIQNLLAGRGFLSRGAISTGLAHHKDTTIFGPALIKAVYREKATKWPRIEVSRETLRSFRSAPDVDGQEICRIREQQLLITEKGGRVMIDPFHHLKFFVNQTEPPPHVHVAPQIEGWRKVIVAGLRQRQKRVLAKYVWMCKRFNAILAKKGSWVHPIAVP